MIYKSNFGITLEHVTKYVKTFIIITVFILTIFSLLNKDIVLVEASFKTALTVSYINAITNIVLNSHAKAYKVLIALAMLTTIFYTIPYSKELWVSIVMVLLYSVSIAISTNGFGIPRVYEESVFIAPLLTLIVLKIGLKDFLQVLTMIIVLTAPLIMVSKYDKLKQNIIVKFPKFSFIGLMFAEYDRKIYKDFEKRIYNILTKIASTSKLNLYLEMVKRLLYNILVAFQELPQSSLSKDIPMFFQKCSNIVRNLDKVLNLTVVILEKTLRTALKTELRLEIQMNRISNFLAKFEYVIEHSFLTMLLMISALLLITIVFYIISLL